jgi:hypothetical protein
LDDLIYAGLAEDAKELKYSQTNLVNLVVNAKNQNLTVFFHITGDFDAPGTKQMSVKVGKHISELLCNLTSRNNDSAVFSFNIKHEFHILCLASQQTTMSSISALQSSD